MVHIVCVSLHLACPWLGLTNRPLPPTASTFYLSNMEFLRQIRLDHLESPGQATPQQESGCSSRVLLPTRSPPPPSSLLARSSWALPLPRLFFLSPFQTAPFISKQSAGPHEAHTSGIYGCTHTVDAQGDQRNQARPSNCGDTAQASTGSVAAPLQTLADSFAEQPLTASRQ